MQACDRHLTRLLASAASAVDPDTWPEWLLLADRLNMPRLVAQCVHPVVRNMLSSSSPAKQALSKLAPISKRTFQLIAEASIYAGVHATNSRCIVYNYVPSASQTSTWAAPGDLFS